MNDLKKHSNSPTSIFYPSAESLLKSVYGEDTRNHIPIDVNRVCKFLNIKIIKDYDNSGEFVGKITKSNNSSYITVNMWENDYWPRYRFTVAHEIGHYCLHLTSSAEKEFIDREFTLFRKSFALGKQEREANQFAAELLIPHKALEYKIREIMPDASTLLGKEWIEYMIRKLADIFEVSNVAMEYRLRNLGLI